MFKTFVNKFPNVSNDVLNQLEAYYSLLVKWNVAHNLVQRETISREQFEVRHLIDCWQLVSCFSKDKPILDIGSGAGLPGILLAIAGFDVHLAEIDQNKASFLKNCKVALNLNCTILNDDIHTCATQYDQVTSRAFSSLNKLLAIQWNVSRETFGVYLKGRSVDQEISEARKNWDFEIQIKDSVTANESKIVIISMLRKSADCFT
jgi:16S rRNA (guanine527-N7)-methyltransferase